ncbi:hypothetical protein L596_014502 [Steinernema carpocapsae]|uniref:Lysosome membrane protein 2 n=1 Tax=Steinernema carpocapsae TaxID=34508 RepID=A0A4U5NCC4_STECR|nr:hypothetical protein L596_014502 [Steinernema carpocapsae]
MQKKTAVVCSLLNLALFLVGIVLLILGLVFALVKVPDSFDNYAKKNYVVGANADGSMNEFLRRWEWSGSSSKNGTHLEVYMYNYSNTLDVINSGLRPDVTEVGPYTYRQEVHVIKKQFTHLNGTEFFEFSKRKSYIFDPERSCTGCTPEDQFLNPDPVFMAAFNMIGSVEKIEKLLEKFCTEPDGCQFIKNLINMIPKVMALAVEAFQQRGPFLNVKVHEILFDGYKDPLFYKTMLSLEKLFYWAHNETYDPTKVKLMIPQPVYKFLGNNTISYNYTIELGKDDYKKSGQLLKMEGKGGVSEEERELPGNWWNASDDSCDARNAKKLFGTNGDFFHPQIGKSESLAMFVEEACRPLKLNFDRETSASGLPAFHFVLDSSTFDYADPENCGFCKPPGASFYGFSENATCLPSGVLDISQCSPSNLSIIVSNPHFFGAEKNVVHLFPRTKRKSEDREVVTVDVEPRTGTVLKANKRLQINVLFQQFPEIPQYSIMPSGVYPMFWINETYVIGDHDLQLLKDDVFGPEKTLKLVCYIVGVGLGSFLIALSTLMFLCTMCCSRKESKSVRITPAPDASHRQIASIEVSADSELRSRVRREAPRH